jgi:hypothetical protein
MVFVTRRLLVGYMKPRPSLGCLHGVSDVSREVKYIHIYVSALSAATRKHVTKCGLQGAANAGCQKRS